jgi:hypothetical protein
MSTQKIVNAPFLYIYGMRITVTGNTSVTVSSGQCRDSNNNVDIVIPSTQTLSLAMNGVNGLDVGTFAGSSAYAIYAIADSREFNAPATLASLSLTAPTMPYGYDVFRRIGFAFSATNLIPIYQCGEGSFRSYVFDEPVSLLASGGATSFTDVSLAGLVPATGNIRVSLQGAFTAGAPGDQANIRAGGSSATNGTIMTGDVAAKMATNTLITTSVLVAGVPKIQYKVTSGAVLILHLVSFETSI